MFKLDIIPMWAKILIVLAILSGTFFYGRHTGWEARDYEVLQEKEDVLEKALADQLTLRTELETKRGELRTISEQLAAALGGQEEVTRYVTRTVTKEIEKPVYRDCVVPSTGVRILRGNVDRLNTLRRPES